MSCTEAREKLPLYVGGDLDRDVLEAVRAHLERCGECHREVQGAVQARRELVLAFREQAAQPRPELWSGIRARLVAEGRILEGAGGRPLQPLRALDAPRSASARPRWSRTLVPLAAAAVVLFVVQLSGVFSELSGPSKRPSPQVPSNGGDLVVAPHTPPSLGGLVPVGAQESVSLPVAYRPERAQRAGARGGVSLTSSTTKSDWK